MQWLKVVGVELALKLECGVSVVIVLSSVFAESRIVESVCAGQCHIQLGCELGDSPAAMLVCVWQQSCSDIHLI